MVKVDLFFKEKDGSIKKETKKFGLRLIPTLLRWIKQGRVLHDVQCKDKYIEGYMRNEILKKQKDPDNYTPSSPIETAAKITGAKASDIRRKMEEKAAPYLAKLKAKDKVKKR